MTESNDVQQMTQDAFDAWMASDAPLVLDPNVAPVSTDDQPTA
ncbi:hypothetical protein AB0G95_21840 [Streptomyces virginiae]